MSKKSCAILYCTFLYKMGHDLLDTQLMGRENACKEGERYREREQDERERDSERKIERERVKIRKHLTQT